MSNYYEDIMPISTNEDEYLKYYIDESLSLFDKLNSIIKKGDPFQRQALITNLDIYARDSLFSSLIQFIISDIGTWEIDSIILFPKSLYKIIVNNKLNNELFNIIFKYMIINISTGGEITRNEYTLYFDKIIEFYCPTKDYLEINNNYDKKEFPYTINNDIFELIISLGKFGQSTINRRLCCYLSSSLCRLIIKDENNIQDDNVQKLFKRLSYISCDGEKMIESQIVRELQYMIPVFKDIIFADEDLNQAIECYIKHDTEHASQSMILIILLNNIINIKEQKKIIELLIMKIKEIIEVKEYEINYKNDIMNNLINCLYNNFKLIPKIIINKIFELGIIEYYINNFDCLESINIFIKNFDKIYFILNNFNENDNNSENNSENNSTFSININQVQSSPVAEIKYQNTILFDELFIKIYNKIYNNYESSETSSSNLLFLEPSDSMNNSSKEKENENNALLNESKKLLFTFLPKILPCILADLKTNKQLMDILHDLFKKENITNILGYFCENKNKKKSEKNKFYKILSFLIKNNYKKYINNLNNNNNLNYIKEFIYENNYFNKLFLLIMNNIYSIYEEIEKNVNSDLYLLIADILNLLIPKLYKYYKNIVIINNNNNNNLNYLINNNNKENNNNNNHKKIFLEKIFDEIFTKIISIVILNKNIGDYIKREYILIIPNLILYSRNRKVYIDYMRKEILKSDNFFYRRYSIIFIKKCFELFSFGFIHKIQLYDDILILIKDKVNIISTGIIDLIYTNIKKIILFSPIIFREICEVLDEVYKININDFNNDIKHFDKDKNIIINHIFNIKDSNNDKDKDNDMFFTEEELNTIKDKENKLSSIENDILNWENNFEKNKNTKNMEQDGINANLLHQINSTSTSFQAIKNNVNSNNHIPFNPKGLMKKFSLLDKTASNLIKNLTSKNIGNNKLYLPKIKGQKIRKDSNCSNGSNSNNNNNLYTIKNNEQNIINNKNGIKEKEKIFAKNRCKLIPCSHNRTPSAKICQDNNYQITNNNDTHDELSYKYNNGRINNKSISNKNINLALKSYLKPKTLSIQKDYNNAYIHGNITSKICINAEKHNSNNTIIK